MPRMRKPSDVPDRPIWMYWTGPPMPEYIRFCVETVKCHHPGRVLFADELDAIDAREAYGMTAAAYGALKLQHRADVLRAYLLHEFGGHWVDADFLCLAPIDGLIPDGYEFAAQWTVQNGERLFDNDFLWARPQSQIACTFFDRIRETLSFNNWQAPSWQALGASILTGIVNRTRPPGFYEIPGDRVTWGRFMCLNLDAGLPNEITDDMLPPDIRGLMLIHSLSKDYLAKTPVPEILQSRTVIGALFRLALRRLT